MSIFIRQEEAATSTRTGRGGATSVADAAASATASVVSAVSNAVGDSTSTNGSHGGTATTSGAASTTSSSSGKNTSAKKAKAAQILKSVHYTWYVTAGVVFACFVVYAYTVARAWYIRRKVAAARRAGAAPSPPAPTVGGSITGGSFLGSLNAAYQNAAYAFVIPTWIWTAKSSAEWWWTVAYTGIVLGLGFWGCIVDGTFDYANPIGFTAFAQIPLIVGLASRNNVLSWITGVSYEKLNYLHRASGRICILTTWLHTLGWFHKGLGKHGPGTKIFLSGMLGSVAALVIWLSSFALARRYFYELFLFLHITMSIIFIVASYYHWPRLGEWCWIGLVIWAFDRVLAALRMFVVNKAWLMPLSSRREEHSACTVELVDPDVVRLTVKRPLLKWAPGQHAFITMPGVALMRYEQHPMTIGNVPDESGNVVFIIRGQTGFTRRLINRCKSTKTTDINCYLEGPYGISHGFNQYDSAILVSGGTGITYALSHFLDIIKQSRNENTAVSHARMVWNVRDAAHVSWIAPLINEAIARGTGKTTFVVDIYVTRTAASDEPGTEMHHELSQSTTPDSPDSYSPSGSSENVSQNEKAASSSGDKLAIAAGLTPAAASIFNFHRGRSHVDTILDHDVRSSATDGAGVGIGVCGPTALSLDVRRAVCNVNKSSAVLKGQNPVTFYSETFGW
jgi:predicted ferric reductase